ncbi:hypothetical protein CDD83_3402 [Cordyceps sp. RAO-2017]|nr:hypothetical protein CDD83_3402 [Cordyceps sp. RAO-2017]
MADGDECADAASASASASDRSCTPKTVAYLDFRHLNVNKNSPSDEAEVESELSDPDSNLHSPPAAGVPEFDEIVVGADRGGSGSSPPRPASTDQDQEMDDVRDESSTASHYPKRKRTSLYNDLSETKMEISQSQPAADERTPLVARDVKSRPSRQSLGGVKGVMLGHWRDSNVPDGSRKHAVIGFIDVRDRLRTRIQPQTKDGESLLEDYPLPPGPGGSWVTFEKVVFSEHLVGLDHFQIKEYTRIRSLAAPEETDEERKAAELEAVKEAVRRVKENPASDNPIASPAIAYGTDAPEHLSTPGRPDIKRRKVSGGYAPGTATPSEGSAPDQARSQTPPQPMAAHQTRFSIDPLPGTRPTRILLGFWKPSSEPDPKDRHAVYGILGQNDMFRVKVVRETRDGRFVDGNFPAGAGALWIPYEEVEFNDHLKALNRQEIKEYCRIRQYQMDHGELKDERIENETKAQRQRADV